MTDMPDDESPVLPSDVCEPTETYLRWVAVLIAMDATDAESASAEMDWYICERIADLDYVADWNYMDEAPRLRDEME